MCRRALARIAHSRQTALEHRAPCQNQKSRSRWRALKSTFVSSRARRTTNCAQRRATDQLRHAENIFLLFPNRKHKTKKSYIARVCFSCVTDIAIAPNWSNSVHDVMSCEQARTRHCNLTVVDRAIVVHVLFRLAHPSGASCATKRA